MNSLGPQTINNTTEKKVKMIPAVLGILPLWDDRATGMSNQCSLNDNLSIHISPKVLNTKSRIILCIRLNVERSIIDIREILILGSILCHKGKDEFI